MINLTFGAWALPLNLIVWRKADCVYRYRTTFSSSAINRYSMEDPSRDKDILCGLSPQYRYYIVEAPPRYRKTFLLLTFTWIVFFCLCFFILFNKKILLLILLTQTRQFRVLILLWKNCVCWRPCIWGGKLASLLCWLLIINVELA